MPAVEWLQRNQTPPHPTPPQTFKSAKGKEGPRHFASVVKNLNETADTSYALIARKFATFKVHTFNAKGDNVCICHVCTNLCMCELASWKFQ